MYLVKRTFRRKDSNVQFFADARFNGYQEKMYKKVLAHNHQIEENDCMRDIHVFYNEEQYQRWADDPVTRKHIEEMSLYNKDNDISFNEVRATV